MFNNFLLIIWVHTFADFFLQSDKMGINKSSSIKWLGIHCLVYSIPFLLFGIQFAVLAGISHLIIDFFTSKGTSYLWQKEMRHWFFCLIGVDQAIHFTLLYFIMKGCN